jgi:hypothetical protein
VETLLELCELLGLELVLRPKQPEALR